MSKAIRCDRCKKCFDPWGAKGEFASIRDLIFQTAESYANHEVTFRDERVDLCPECTKKFSEFICENKDVVPLGDYLSLEREYDDLQSELDQLYYQKVPEMKLEVIRAIRQLPAIDIKDFVERIVRDALYGGVNFAKNADPKTEKDGV